MNSHEVSGPSDIGRAVREARRKRSLTQQELADYAGVGLRFVSELENGKATAHLGKALSVLRTLGIAVRLET